LGILEEVLTEKLAADLWRMRRLYRFETGLIRRQLDCAADDLYNKSDPWGNTLRDREKELTGRVAAAGQGLENLREEEEYLTRLYQEAQPLAETYDCEDSWHSLHYEVQELLDENGLGRKVFPPPELHKTLGELFDWSESQIWEELLSACRKELREFQQSLPLVREELQKEKENNTLKLQVKKKLGVVPQKEDLDRLLRYEVAVNRQFYRTLRELQRLQQLRLRDSAPPLRVDAQVLPDKD
jgi:hypothetical protein